MTAEEFARSVRGATRPPDPSGWWRALCPAHDDNQPSLSFRDGKNGLLVRCHAGCLDEAVLGAVEKAAGSQPGAAVRTIDKAYRYTDAAGNLLYEVVRFKPKTFRQRRPNGSGGWIWDMKGVPRVLYRLNELRGHRVAYVPEGEKDVDRLWSLGLAATTNPGGAGKWQPEFVDQLKIAGIELVVVIPDSDDPGRAHAQDIARACALGGLSARIVTLDLSTGGDISDWLDGGHKKGELIFLAKRASNFQAMEVPGSPPWAAARPAPEFIAEKDLELNFLVPKLLLPGNVTMLFSPRGIGKTLMAHALAVDLAKKNHRVLLVDRDNSSQLLRSRLKNWGASEAQNLDILTRDKAPALTDGKAWKSFPEKYDLVIIDSLDAATEGVGEGDSAKPSKALAAILDIAHRSGERAAFLVLGNTVKSGAHSRGSGVIEDRGDIVYEVRDATGFSPSGKVSWWLELPGQGAGAWGERARRRPTQRMYRLALVNSKFRPGSEPEPFILQVDLGPEPWRLSDVTTLVVQEAEEGRSQARAEQENSLTAALGALEAEVKRRHEDGKPLVCVADAVPFLMKLASVSRDKARAVILENQSQRWQLIPQGGPRGRPSIVLIPLGSRPGPAGNTPRPRPQFLKREPGALSAGPGNSAPQESQPPKPLSTRRFKPGNYLPPAKVQSPDEVEL